MSLLVEFLIGKVPVYNKDGRALRWVNLTPDPRCKCVLKPGEAVASVLTNFCHFERTIGGYCSKNSLQISDLQSNSEIGTSYDLGRSTLVRILALYSPNLPKSKCTSLDHFI